MRRATRGGFYRLSSVILHKVLSAGAVMVRDTIVLSARDEHGINLRADCSAAVSQVRRIPCLNVASRVTVARVDAGFFVSSRKGGVKALDSQGVKEPSRL